MDSTKLAQSCVKGVDFSWKSTVKRKKKEFFKKKIVSGFQCYCK